MKMKNKKILTIASTCALLIVELIIVINNSNNVSKNFAKASISECDFHNGYHYVAKQPTIDESGWVEFWACCECNHQYIGTAPEGNWVTRDSSEMIGSVNESHIAYLPVLESGGENGDYWGKDPF